MQKQIHYYLIEKQGQGHTVEVLKLAEEDLKPLSGADTERRGEAIQNGNLDHPMFAYAHQFKTADAIVVAAPYWDLSFPSALKVYLEQICVTGLTFGYEGADCVGYCQAKKLIYLSTCGGFVQGIHLGASYVKALGEMLGIHDFEEFAVEGLDIDPMRVEALMTEGFERMLSKISLI